MIPSLLDNVGKHLGGGIAGEVNWVGLDGMGRYKRSNGLSHFGRQRSSVNSFLLCLIRGKDSGAAGGGNKKNLVAP